MRLGRHLLRCAILKESVKELSRRTRRPDGSRLSKQAIYALANGERIVPNVDTAMALQDAAGIPIASWSWKFEDADLSTRVDTDGTSEIEEVENR